ncbi:50S ribosomal protein L4 [Coprothermobacter platensis]|uniref:50S ribosomal protein L4 n=1 Tax=Coprothermobacter platensis TaxID=108819 RepID=UPI000360A292|nr:50S ribosomal protein L4 [Coprothermobacter platensis]
MQLPVFDVNGAEVAYESVNENFVATPVRGRLLHLNVVRVLAGKRHGTASTKKQGEVAGTTKKPWPQKHTGRARHGYMRSPIWRKGAVAFGPRPRDWSMDINKKQIKLGMASAFGYRLRNGELVLVDANGFNGKTREFRTFLNNKQLENKSVTVVSLANEVSFRRACQNMKNVYCVPVEKVNVYDLLKGDTVIMTQAAWKKAQEVWANG